MKTITLRDLPYSMIKRILPKKVSDAELAYAGIRTVLFIPTIDGGTYVVFENYSEWNYLTYVCAGTLFRRMSGI